MPLIPTDWSYPKTHKSVGALGCPMYPLCVTEPAVSPLSMSHSPSMSTARYLSLKSSSNGSASNSATVLPNTKQDVEKAEMVPPRQDISLSPTIASRLTLPLAYRQIIALHRKTPDQQDIEEWERARVNLKLRWCKLFLAVSSILPILPQCI